MVKIGVISDTHVSSDEASFKGEDVLEAGYVYAPYIPLYTTPTLHIGDIVSPKVEIEVKIYPIKKYKDIYADRKNRFDILDL